MNDSKLALFAFILDNKSCANLCGGISMRFNFN